MSIHPLIIGIKSHESRDFFANKLPKFSKRQAELFHEFEGYNLLTPEELVGIQLFQPHQIIPDKDYFPAFYEIFGREYYRTRFQTKENLRNEFLGKPTKPVPDSPFRPLYKDTDSATFPKEFFRMPILIPLNAGFNIEGTPCGDTKDSLCPACYIDMLHEGIKQISKLLQQGEQQDSVNPDIKWECIKKLDSLINMFESEKTTEWQKELIKNQKQEGF